MAIKLRILRAGAAGNRPVSLEAGQVFIDEYQGVISMRNASGAGIVDFSLGQIAILAGQVGAMATQSDVDTAISTAISTLSFATADDVNSAVATGVSGLVGGSPEAYNTLQEIFALAQNNSDAQTALASGQANKCTKSENLNDLPDKVLARNNLGLGDLALVNIADLVIDEGTV